MIFDSKAMWHKIGLLYILLILVGSIQPSSGGVALLCRDHKGANVQLTIQSLQRASRAVDTHVGIAMERLVSNSLFKYHALSDACDVHPPSTWVIIFNDVLLFDPERLIAELRPGYSFVFDSLRPSDEITLDDLENLSIGDGLFIARCGPSTTRLLFHIRDFFGKMSSCGSHDECKRMENQAIATYMRMHDPTRYMSRFARLSPTADSFRRGDFAVTIPDVGFRTNVDEAFISAFTTGIWSDFLLKRMFSMAEAPRPSRPVRYSADGLPLRTYLPMFPIRSEIGELLEIDGLQVGVEVGVAEGEFAAAVLDTWHSCTSYYLIDPWVELENYVDSTKADDATWQSLYDAAVKAVEPFRDKVHLMRNFSFEVADEFADASLDFIYIDARHDYMSVLQDLE
eukprot:Rmarinus@m.16558